MTRLFSVYKVENGGEILLGGLADRRKSGRKRSSHTELLRMARKKFARFPEEEIRIVLREER